MNECRPVMTHLPAWLTAAATSVTVRSRWFSNTCLKTWSPSKSFILGRPHFLPFNGNPVEGSFPRKRNRTVLTCNPTSSAIVSIERTLPSTFFARRRWMILQTSGEVGLGIFHRKPQTVRWSSTFATLSGFVYVLQARLVASQSYLFIRTPANGLSLQRLANLFGCAIQYQHLYSPKNLRPLISGYAECV